MPAKTAPKNSPDYFVFDGQKIPLWPIRGKRLIPRAVMRKAVRTALRDLNMLREGA